MRIYNSLTDKVEEFKPIEEGKVTMYVCGPTVYNYVHIGNMRPVMTFDMVYNYFKYLGYDVTYASNFTDVNPKIITAAKELGITEREVADKFIKAYLNDLESYNCSTIDYRPRVIENMENIYNFITKLIEKDMAYEVDGDVYFRVDRIKDYGVLSNQDTEELVAGARVEVDEKKESPLDFALWRKTTEGEQFDSPWGKGIPGWHTECVVMINALFGKKIDIHGGGKDLIFPHHEDEIAQSEAYLGKEFAKVWSHCGLIKINGEKMSKSLGNSLTIRDALAKYNYEVIKYVFLQKHYTADIDISDSDFRLAEKHLHYFYDTLYRASGLSNRYKDDSNNYLEGYNVDDIKDKFIEAMDDDFNTPIAISYLYDIFKYMNYIMKNVNKGNRVQTANTLSNIINSLKDVYGVIGLFGQEPENFIENMKNKYLNELNISKEEIERQIQERKNAKENKDFDLADSIRDKLLAAGIVLNDTREGTTWTIRQLYSAE